MRNDDGNLLLFILKEMREQMSELEQISHDCRKVKHPLGDLIVINAYQKLFGLSRHL